MNLVELHVIGTKSLDIDVTWFVDSYFHDFWIVEKWPQRLKCSI